MRKHHTVLSVLAATGLCGLIAFTVLRSNEPQYAGHTLSYWLHRHSEFVKAGRPDTAQSDASRKAVLAIGTNAIPWLIKWIRYEPNPVPKPVLNRVQYSLWSTRLGRAIMFGTGQENSRAQAAVWSFATLGTNAAPAINDLVLMMQDGSHPMTSTRAIMALGGMGQCAFSPLARALSNPKQRERQLVALELFEMSRDPTVGTNKVLPFIAMATNDSDPQLRSYASNFLTSVAFAIPTNAAEQ